MAILSENNVFIEEQSKASQIYNRGYFGTPQSGGSLKLNLIEACFLLETEKIEVCKKNKKLELKDLIYYATNIYHDFEIKYTVYKNIRQRGYIVKINEEFFDVYERGKNIKDKPKIILLPISERENFSIENINEKISLAKKENRELLIGIVDEEGDLTYYKVSKITPKGKEKLKLPNKKGDALLIEDRVIIWDKELAEELLKTQFFGKSMGKYFQLSLVETTYLAEKGIIEIKNAKTNRKLSLKEFVKRAKEIQDDFDLRLTSYKNMKVKDLIVKTGFKYGTYFRVYDENPDKTHSKYLVHVLPYNFVSSWAEISRAIRLAHGVRKEMLFATIKDGNIRYIRLGRVRP